MYRRSVLEEEYAGYHRCIGCRQWVVVDHQECIDIQADNKPLESIVTLKEESPHAD